MNRRRFTLGIITFHRPISYGANLQCLGLLLFLRGKGYDAEIIDYSDMAYQQMRKENKLRSLLLMLARYASNGLSLLKSKRNASRITKQQQQYTDELTERRRRFEEFQIKYYKTSPLIYSGCNDIKRTPPSYSAYICGSDQIWNPSFCDMDDNYFLAFAPKRRRIAYAPSFGQARLPWYAKLVYRKRLKNIDYLSVREETGREIIRRLIGKEVPVVIDPTLLISSDEWKKIAETSIVETPQKYILTYFIGIDDYIKHYIDGIKQVYSDYEIVNLVFDQTNYGPADFLKLISCASFVFTNSFHGMAFCINFNVPFVVGRTMKDQGKGNAFSRIDNLLIELGLSGRIINVGDVLDETYLNLDFSTANKRRQEWVTCSETYLLNAIESIKRADE